MENIIFHTHSPPTSLFGKVSQFARVRDAKRNGPISQACLAQAVAEFTVANPEVKMEVKSADHRNKADIAASVLRNWFDQDGVDMALNITNSAVALAALAAPAASAKGDASSSRHDPAIGVAIRGRPRYNGPPA